MSYSSLLVVILTFGGLLAVILMTLVVAVQVTAVQVTAIIAG